MTTRSQEDFSCDLFYWQWRRDSDSGLTAFFYFGNDAGHMRSVWYCCRFFFVLGIVGAAKPFQSDRRERRNEAKAKPRKARPAPGGEHPYKNLEVFI